MEMKAYWAVVWRRWWIIAVLVVVVLGASYVLTPKPTTTWTATMRFTIGLAATGSLTGTLYYDPAYYDWLVSEYLADDFSEVVKSAVFAEDVSRCAGQGVSAGAIQGAANTQKLHRIISLTISGQDEKQVGAIAECAAKSLRENNAKYFAQLNTYRASVTVIDGPNLSVSAAGLRERVDLPIRLLLAAIAGVALAFLIDYLDDSVRDARDVEQAGLKVLGEIPHRAR
ncbi:MAG: hypothetical protein HYR71_06230 [Chloroflexi bacterium]|nr:hypothetical protein [Chloroflexota bacterium]